MSLVLSAADEALRLPTPIDLTAVIVGALLGAVLAADKGLSVTGVLALALSTGLGGGLIRDILLGQGPPVALTNPLYLPTVAAASGLAFFFAALLARLTPVLLTLDALALGLFTVIGAEKAQIMGLPMASVVFIGVVTAVGGGFLRDVFIGRPPDFALPGPINAVAAIVGSVWLSLLAGPLHAPRLLTEITTVTIVAALRLLALWRDWQAPLPVDLAGRIADLRMPTRGRKVAAHLDSRRFLTRP